LNLIYFNSTGKVKEKEEKTDPSSGCSGRRLILMMLIRMQHLGKDRRRR
jgi:hypothetical protein